MRTAALTTLLLLAASAQAVPALAEKPPRWEYAELIHRTLPSQPATVGPDGTEIPAVPASASVRWITATEEVVA